MELFDRSDLTTQDVVHLFQDATFCPGAKIAPNAFGREILGQEPPVAAGS